MKKNIIVPPRKYLITLLIVIAHVLLLSFIAINFLPGFRLEVIYILGIGFYLFKVINYLRGSVKIDEKSLMINRLIKKRFSIPFKEIKEIEIIGPSQFNSNHMMAFYGEGRQELGRFPFYWFSRLEVTLILETIKSKKPNVLYHKQLNQYLAGQYWKYLLVNYIIQYTLIAGIIAFIVMKYS